MFSNKPPNKKPSLLTLADRVSKTTNSGHAEGSDDDNKAGEGGISANSIWKTFRQNAKAKSAAPGYEEAIASIERDVDNLVSDENMDYQSYVHAENDAFRPLIDPFIVASAIWRWRWPIVATTFLGGVAGVIIALSTPHVYTAYNQVLIDPRQVKLVERDLTPEFLGNESALAIVDSKLESVYSTPVLQRVIDKLNLHEVAEFNGSADEGIGLLNGIAFVRSLFSAETPIETNDRRIIENLRKAISASRESSTFVFSITADSQSPRLAAQISNAVTESFIENQIEREALAARSASTALGSQLVKLKAAVEDAELKAELFAQANNLTRVEGLTLTDSQLVATSAQLSEAKAATIRAKSIAEAAQSASVDAVVNGALPPELVNTTLSNIRAQFSSLDQNAAALEQALGPKHPRLATAIAARESARSEIAAELQRIIAGTQADLRRAIRNEQQIAASLAETRAEKGQSGEALITLRELESEIEAAQSIYKTALLRSQETNQLESLVSVNATIISEAEPPLYASSISRKFIAASGAFAGFMIGLGGAFVTGLRDCFQSSRNAPKRNPSPNGSTIAHSRRPRNAGVENYANAGIAPQGAFSGARAMQEETPYPAHVQAPQYQPATQPYAEPYPQPVPAAAYAPPPQQMYNRSQPQYHETTAISSLDEEMEMEEIRASVREIREVLDQLKKSRNVRQRFG